MKSVLSGRALYQDVIFDLRDIDVALENKWEYQNKIELE